MTLKRDANTKKWIKDKNGNLLCVYQTEEKNKDGENYTASSFEDAFFHINREFIIKDNKKAFKGDSGDKKKGLKNLNFFNKKKDDEYKYNPYQLAGKCINKKPVFAMEILLNSDEKNDSDEDYSN